MHKVKERDLPVGSSVMGEQKINTKEDKDGGKKIAP